MHIQGRPAFSDYRSWQLMPGASAQPPATLMWSDELPTEIVDRHVAGGDVPAISMHEVVGAEYGGQGLMSIDGKPFMPKECLPGYLESMSTNLLREDRDHRWFGALFAPTSRKIACDRSILAPFHPNLIYGHFLTEMLPRLLVADKWDTTGAPLALCKKTPSWLQMIVAALAPSREVIWFDSRTEILIPRAVLIPSAMLGDQQHFHPQIRTLFAELKDKIGIDGKRPARKLLYLSRSRKPDKEAWHKIRNERAIERLFCELGFEIIHPQELSFKQQVSLYDEAAVLAGEFSSALHNSLFARPGCRVFAINWINWYQSRISALMNQPIAYVPTVNGFRDWQSQALGFQSLEIDLDRLRAKLEIFLLESSVDICLERSNQIADLTQ